MSLEGPLGHPASLLEPKRFPNLHHLTGLSSRQLDEHLRVYAAHVHAVNMVEEHARLLARSGRRGDPTWSGLQRRRAFEANGVRLHELYFETFRSGGTPLDEAPVLRDAIHRDFGSVDTWHDDLMACATSPGVGWAMLCMDETSGRLLNHWVTLHQDGQIAGYRPVLVLDMWEHAYLLDYRSAEKRGYVETFLRHVDWLVCERRVA